VINVHRGHKNEKEVVRNPMKDMDEKGEKMAGARHSAEFIMGHAKIGCEKLTRGGGLACYAVANRFWPMTNFP